MINDFATYIINLEKRKDRLELILKDIPFERFEIRKAIDAIEYSLTPITACTISHLNLIETYYKNPYTYKHLLILEDDCSFVPDFTTKFNQVLNTLPSDWDFFYTSGNNIVAPYPVKVNEDWMKVTNCLTSHFIAFNVKSLEKIFKQMHQIFKENKPVDVCYTELQKTMNVYCTSSYLTGQRPDHSDIEGTFKNYQMELSDIEFKKRTNYY